MESKKAHLLVIALSFLAEGGTLKRRSVIFNSKTVGV